MDEREHQSTRVHLGETARKHETLIQKYGSAEAQLFTKAVRIW